MKKLHVFIRSICFCVCLAFVAFSLVFFIRALVASSDNGAVSSAASSLSFPLVLLLTPVGYESNGLIASYLTLISNLSYPRQRLSLGFLFNDNGNVAMATIMLKQLVALGFRSVQVFYHDPGDYLPSKHADRHIVQQAPRRRYLAMLRNYLLMSALRDEEYVLWVDLDILQWPADILQQLMAKRANVTVPTVMVGNNIYDVNSWRWRSTEHKNNYWKNFGHRPVFFMGYDPSEYWRLTLADLADQDEVSLHAVGGAVLLVTADVHRHGCVFPPVPFQKLLETEGFAACALQQSFKVIGLPKLIVQHKPE